MAKQTKRMKAAQEEHDKFLKKMGLSRKTICKDKPSNFPVFLKEFTTEKYNEGLSNTDKAHKGAGSKKGILSDIMNYTEADRAIAREMSKSVSVEYNKGGLQYISKGTDLTKMGKKV